MDASEHQDSDSREDDEDDDWSHNDDGQCGHTVVGQLISCEGEKNLKRVTFPHTRIKLKLDF